jgi:hypothetical protein
MTESELIQISRDFRKMIETIPKTRVGTHMPTINQISRLLERLQNEIYQTPHISVASPVGHKKYD